MFVALVGGALLVSAHAQKLDVEYVPTPQSIVKRMLDMAAVGPKDYVIDLGCGDGRIAIAAALRGARALGVDLDPNRIKEATVLTLYLLPELNRKLSPTILKLKPGTRVVSHEFDMDPWVADRHVEIGENEIYYWVVPAPVAGNWQVKSGEQEFTVAIKQSFQRIRGTAQIGKRSVPLRNAKMQGDKIEFVVTLNGKRVPFRGTVDGDKMSGKNNAGVEWTASRS
ncbi:MAG TPA: 50S ribosomal protein L11 methyltransferase [Gammaproteobacteria bacterium]|nr:50S ribosomal protein L11 methyltransferase [Gammaproteobacteria bacterium]